MNCEGQRVLVGFLFGCGLEERHGRVVIGAAALWIEITCLARVHFLVNGLMHIGQRNLPLPADLCCSLRWRKMVSLFLAIHSPHVRHE